MLASELYSWRGNAELEGEYKIAQDLMSRFNSATSDEERAQIFKVMIPKQGKNCYIKPPFHFDYAEYIEMGDNVFINFNGVVLGAVPVKIGSHTMIGPHCGIYASTHPVDAELRLKLLDYGLPITIGVNVWIGGGVTILPGVTIGDNSVIGGGSVVATDIPANCVAVGNPAKAIKTITPPKNWKPKL